MKTSITIRLDEELDQVSRKAGRTRSDVIREALRRQLSIQMFEQLRGEVMPSADAQGYLTDEEVFQDIS